MTKFKASAQVVDLIDLDEGWLALVGNQLLRLGPAAGAAARHCVEEPRSLADLEAFLVTRFGDPSGGLEDRIFELIEELSTSGLLEELP